MIDKLRALFLWFSDTTQRLLQGEPLRMMLYVGALLVWAVSNIANNLGFDGIPRVNLDEATAAVSAALVFITELLRRYVYSPATVARLIDGNGPEVAP